MYLIKGTAFAKAYSVSGTWTSNCMFLHCYFLLAITQLQKWEGICFDMTIQLSSLSYPYFFSSFSSPTSIPTPVSALGEPSIPGQMHERFPGQQFTLYSIQIASVEFYFSISMILLAVYLHHEMYSLSPLIEELIDWFPNDNDLPYSLSRYYLKESKELQILD